MASNFWIVASLTLGLISFGIPLVIGLIGELWYYLKYQKELKKYEETLKENPDDVYNRYYPSSRYYFGQGFYELSMENIYLAPSVILYILGGVCALVFIVNIVAMFDFKNHEDILYEKYTQEREYVQNVVDNEKTVVRETVIQSVLEYNEEIIEYRTLYNSGKYTNSFSGKYDWNTLEPIILE